MRFAVSAEVFPLPTLRRPFVLLRLCWSGPFEFSSLTCRLSLSLIRRAARLGLPTSCSSSLSW